MSPMPIRQITISGFRGILMPLSLDFCGDGSSKPRSMCIYGRNGTGKSSITDAWEWLQNGRVEHLRREGAEESAYPHINAEPGDTYIEVQCSDPGLGNIRLEHQFNRVTKPKIKGKLPQLRLLAPHPCQLRFADLTRFVFKTKGEKYEALAQLMGFQPQVEVQKGLRRVERQIEERVQECFQREQDLRAKLSTLLSLTDVRASTVCAGLRDMLLHHSLGPAATMEEARQHMDQLRNMVESDPRAKELAEIVLVLGKIVALGVVVDVGGHIDDYVEDCRKLQAAEHSILDLVRLRLYEVGQDVLEQIATTGRDPNICPLCGTEYDGDLRIHVSAELTRLGELSKLRDRLETRRAQIGRAANAVRGIVDAIHELWHQHKDLLCNLKQGGLTALHEFYPLLQTLQNLIDIAPEKLTADHLDELPAIKDRWNRSREALTLGLECVDKRLTARREELENDASRKQLVDDYGIGSRALEQWDELVLVSQIRGRLARVHIWFAAVMSDYVSRCMEDVQVRFNLISANVERYFDVLEQDSGCLSKPTLQLVSDQDRAVELAIKFYDDSICPAYKYLSESQLNSFGLAIFLASVRQFNSAFPFLILDDVINSFDVYKRPRVVDLLRDQFNDHQLLLLTHDSIWYDLICDKCPSWIKKRFVRLERMVGPIESHSSAGGYDRIKELLDDDRPVEAGRSMGTYLELQMAELCECFEALVKYNRRNEHTIEPLLSHFRSRVADQLGKNHPLFASVKDLHESSSFRNFCAHWKDPEFHITVSEMSKILAKWDAVRLHVFCDNCGRYLEFDNNLFICKKCHKKIVSKTP